MRKLGTCVAALKKGDINDFLRLIREVGFETVFTGAGEEEIKAVQAFGMPIDNTHSPFGGINHMWMEGEDGEIMLKRLMDSVDLCAAYDIPKTVIHLSSGLTPPRINDLGYKRFDTLVNHGVKKGVHLAFENQRMLANLSFIMEEYKDVPEVGFCWDCGHEACFTGGREYMPLFGDRLSCIHLHDNHGVFNQDQHILPFDGTLNWEKAARYIKNSPYKGPIMLEVFYRPGEVTGYYDYDNITDEEYYTRAYRAAAKIRDMIEE